MNTRREKEVKILFKVLSKILVDQKDLRFGQLVANLSHPVDPFYVSDQDLLNAAIAYLEKLNQPLI